MRSAPMERKYIVEQLSTGALEMRLKAKAISMSMKSNKFKWKESNGGRPKGVQTAKAQLLENLLKHKAHSRGSKEEGGGKEVIRDIES